MTNKNKDLAEIQGNLRLKLQDVVVGRHKEIKALKKQLDIILQGHSAMAIITGDMGVGKTALVKTVLADIAKVDATCIYGKFEQYKGKEPYIAIIQIIESITSHR